MQDRLASSRRPPLIVVFEENPFEKATHHFVYKFMACRSDSLPSRPVMIAAMKRRNQLVTALVLETACLEIRKSLSRNDAMEFRVERATGPFCRATRPTAVRTTRSLNGERWPCVRLGGKLPPRTAKLAVPPGLTAWIRLSEVLPSFPLSLDCMNAIVSP